MTAPELPDDCWPISYPAGCAAIFAPEAEGYDADVAAMANALAVSTLRVLTAYRVGGCPVVLRPATRACCEATWGVFPVTGGLGVRPRLDSGSWINVPCSCDTDPCRCSSRLTHVTLPGPVGVIAEVRVDGEVLDPEAYAVDTGGSLWRLDGGVWPRTQDLAAAPTEPGTFAVTYTPGIPVDGIGARAAGLLACELSKAILGDDSCSLPRNVTQIVRNNVAMTIADPQGRLFPNGLTGLPLVDTYVARWNPHGLRAPSTVWSPDLPRHRTTPADPGTYAPVGNILDGGTP